MSSEVRARVRPPSPTPSSSYPSRFPPRPHDQLDADERKALAKSGSLKHSQHAFGGLRLSSAEWKLLAAVVVVALFVRLHHLSWPTSVVFDEVHFGKFAGKYILTRYYVDVHPPLAKLLITFMAVLGGFDASFDFKDIGRLYPSNVPYVLMRSLPAILGVGVVPLSYLTLRGLDCRPITALLGALFITFENGLITQSRLILLDSPLIFFTALTIFLWVGFTNENHQQPFTEDWWLWLTLTGLSLGAVSSCKWVGLFTVTTVGLATIKQLWDLLGDLRVSPRLWMKHFLARALCLIVLPIMVYMAVFEIHFLVLQNSGDGDGFMSPEFQHTLKGKGMQDTWADVALGSEVTLRHVNTQGGYLHSHDHTYPTGSKQQQITLYPHRDSNNNWRIIHAQKEGDPDRDYATEPITYVTPGMVVRFEHVSTSKRLHSHDMRPPVSEVDFQNEVSGYGFPGFIGDANDNWIVEIEHGSNRDKHSHKRVRTIRTVFRLRHALQGCYLFSHKVKLPDWGYEQQEVTCNKNAVKENSLWYIETNSHPQLGPDSDKVNYHLPGFLGKFWELQKVMWITNAGLTERHSFDSRPSSWLTLKRGINFWVRDHRQIYLLGNPFIWWLSSSAIFMYVAARGIIILRAKRQYKDLNNSIVLKYDQICGFLTIGWFIHYFPFFLMARQLFLHHYFPALYFAILLFCAVFDLAASAFKSRIRLQMAGVLIVIAVWTWYHFSALVYGGQWTKGKCENAKWLRTWDFSCGDFPASYSDYKNFPLVSDPPAPAPTTAAVVPDGGAHGKPQAVGGADDPANNADAAPPAAQTESVINQVEPGRNVFQDKVDQKQSIASMSAAEGGVKKGPDGEPVPQGPPPLDEVVSVSKPGDPVAEKAANQAVKPPPPLPKNELKDMSTAEPEQQPQGKAQVKEAVPEAKAEAKAEQKPAVAGDGAAAAEEEKVRKELFPDAAR
ncbi:hypothetical protein FRB99_004525 [Tulasnella sp. 403]|nr:hypothetical protein FRB99_004525 [Tulasnella sp. 403]